MASPASRTASRSPLRSVHRSAPDTWPLATADRWLLRAALALPFVVVAVASRTSPWIPQADRELAARGVAIAWGDSGLHWMATTFPPLSAAVSSVVRGNHLAFNLIAAVVLGFVLQRLTGVLIRRGVGLWGTIAVLGTLLLTPPLYYIAATNLQGLLGLALIVVALDGIASFVEDQNTEAGFRAGLALGLAVMVDSGAWLYALTLGAIAPFFARHAGRQGRGANRATFAVLLFPACAAVLFWLYASWWFSADPLGGLEHAAAQGWFPGGVGASARAAAIAVGQGIVAVPLFWVAFGMRLLRDPWQLIAPTIAVAGLFLTLWTGLREPGGQTYVLLTVLYILLLVSRRPQPRRRVLIVVASATQLVIAWSVVWNSSTVGDWVRTVAGF